MTQPEENGSVELTHMRVEIELEIPSDVRYIERVVEVLTRQCGEFAYPSRHCSLNIPVAISEALSNAILRGNREDVGKHVRVRANLDHDGMVVEVTDEGGGFDFDHCLIDPTHPDNISREDGRGLFLMKRLMDRVELFRDGGSGIRLTLRRP